VRCFAILVLPAIAATLGGCAPLATVTPADTAATIAVVERGWHTDICLRSEDAGEDVMALASDFPGVRFLCFGFGDRAYVVRRDHSLLTMMLALVPGRGAVLMTALRAPPSEAFGEGHTVSLKVSRAGLDGLRDFLSHAVQKDADGTPVRLGNGPYEGSAFFSASAAYSLAYTCNTWTADALRHAGLPVAGVAVFVNDIMVQARQIAVDQSGARPAPGSVPAEDSR